MLGAPPENPVRISGLVTAAGRPVGDTMVSFIPVAGGAGPSAAEACSVAQPSLTKAIKKLEEELGGALFHRERSKTQLTELGNLMKPHLETISRPARRPRRMPTASRAWIRR